MAYTVHGILQPRILEWVALAFSRGFFQHRDRTQVSQIAGRIIIANTARSLGADDGGGGALVAKSCPTLATPWTVACQALLSMGFSRQEYWSGLPFPSPIFLILKATVVTGDQSWVFIGRADAQAETPILCPPHAKS